MFKITYQELQEYLQEIFSCNAFELHTVIDEQGISSFYIPYMMNDALECYILLKDGRMTGNYLSDFQGEMTVELIEEADHKPALIFHQGYDNVFTLWFEDCFRVLKCYRYDQIGHFWVKGQEQWRRLVYIIGTIHDKYNYMGESVCNELEMELLPLMEFAPFRYYSPIRESLDEYYVNSAAGVQTMKRVAQEAGDVSFLLGLRLYDVLPFKQMITRLLAGALAHPGRIKLYQMLFYKVQAASMEYPERTYSAGMSQEIQNAREQVGRKLRDCGFTGEYPLFQRGRMQILAMEEHPFVVLESENYNFRIQFMVSETRKMDTRLNAGFFREPGWNVGGILRTAASKKGNRGWIARNLDFL